MICLKRSILCTILLSCFTIAGNTQTALPIDPDVRIGTLPNGLKYYIQANKKPEDRAALRLVIHAGSINEDEDQLGLAHFVEHMAFNGTAHFEKNELINYLEKTGTRFGADLNAYTSFEETVYKIDARTDSLALLEKGLLILEDWASGLTFDPEEIDKERGVVLSEWRTGLSPDQRMQQEYFPVIYHNSRFANRLPIGSPKIIEEADYATIRRFYEDWYRPDLMAVVAVGDFDLDWMEKEIKSRFSKIPSSEKQRPHPSIEVPSHEETLFSIVSDKEAPFTRVRIMYKHKGKDIGNKQDYRQHLAHLLYNRMLNARMQELQLQANPPFTFAYSGFGSNIGDMAAYTTYAFVKEGQALKGIGAVLEETYRAMQHGFLQSELDRQKTAMLEGARRALKEAGKIPSNSLSRRYVGHFLNDNPIPSPQQQYELYQELLPTIRLSDINPLPKEWLTEDNRVIIVTGPEGEEGELPNKEELISLINTIAASTYQPYVDQVNDAPLMTDFPPQTLIQSSKSMGGIEVDQLKLQNGVTVYLKPTDFQNDEIIMSAFSPGGHSLYSDQEFSSASAADIIANQSGLSTFTFTELEKKLTGKKVSVAPYISELNEGLSANCSPEELETLFQLIYLYFTEPRFDSTALASYQSRQTTIYENILDNPYYYFANEKLKIKYDNHPRRAITTVDDIQSMDMSTIKKVYEDRFADASDFTFVFVGNFNKATLYQLAAQYLGNLPTQNREENWKDIGANLVKGNIQKTYKRGEAPKSIVEMTYHGSFDDESSNRYKFNTLMAVLRIRLREQMREESSGVYGVQVRGSVLAIPTSRYMVTISFNAEPERTEELLEIAKEVINSFKTEGPTEDEMEKVRETQRQNHIKGLKENNFWLGQLVYRVKNKEPLENIQLKYLESVMEGVDALDIQQAARTFFNEENLITLMLLPEAPDK
ncbi:MAG: insulinase family protein [Chitinophagales bacterium]|nr:insulinase family protein [Chitinophagales bacterium]